MLFCKVELMLVSLLDFLDNAYSGSARSTLLRESSNEMVGNARHLYLMKGEILINGKIIEKSWFTNSKMNKKKIESKSHHKVFVLIIYSEVTLTFKCITLLQTVSALLSGGFFSSNQENSVFICTKVWKKLNNQIKLELEIKF